MTDANRAPMRSSRALDLDRFYAVPDGSFVWTRSEDGCYAFSRGGRNVQRIGLTGAGEATAQVWELLS